MMQASRPRIVRSLMRYLISRQTPVLHRQMPVLHHNAGQQTQLSSVSVCGGHKYNSRMMADNMNLYSMNICHLHTTSALAKKKKDKGGKKSGKPKVELTHKELNQVINFDKFTQQMELALEGLKREYIEQLTLRTTSGVFDQLSVETADGTFPLIQLGQVVQKNPTLVAINMAASPQYIGNVKDALLQSGMNVNPQQDGTSLFVPIPKVTREHREQLAQNAKRLCDKTKERLRDIQNKYVRDLKKDKATSADLVHNLHETLMLETQRHVKIAEELMRTKQQELIGK